MTAGDHERDGPPVDLTGVRVLVVDDSPPVGDSVKVLLELWGAKVIGPATSSAEADRLLPETIPDLALVDFHLGHGETASGLIDRLTERGVTVIVLSGSNLAPDVKPKDVAAILRKPVDMNLLLAALRSFIAQRP